MKAVLRFLAAFWACDPVEPPAPPLPKPGRFPPVTEKVWTAEAARERQNSPEMQQWVRNWNGNGLPDGLAFPKGSPLHDHPHSRPGAVMPCPECQFPDFGWGGWDHYPQCSKYRQQRI